MQETYRYRCPAPLKLLLLLLYESKISSYRRGTAGNRRQYSRQDDFLFGLTDKPW
jgi:hypothetical protein